MPNNYKRLIADLGNMKHNLETNKDIILSVNEIAFLDKLLGVMESFINGELE